MTSFLNSALWTIPALPLAGAFGLLLLGRRSDRWGHLLGCATAIASFVVGAVMFAGLLGLDANARLAQQTVFTWVPVGELQVDLGLRLDALSICFVLLITGVGSLIHLYSIGYMAHDPERRKFFAYLNLFLAAMLVLVLADNFLVLYLGWEASVSPPTCSSASGSTSPPPRPPRRRRSSSTASATWGCSSLS